MASSRRTLEHVGELKVELEADSFEELFSELAHVIADATGTHRESGKAEWEHVDLSARDLPTLLVDWANELIGRSEVSGLAYSNVRNLVVVDAANGVAARVAADVRGDNVEAWASAIKAATYHGATVEWSSGRWRAVILLDV